MSSLFSFQGRLNRLQYALRLLLLTLVIGVPVLALTVSMVLDGPAKALGSFGLLGVMFVIILPAVLWMSFAFQARRFRDIGLNPLFTILGWIGVMIVDGFLARAMPSLSLRPLVHQTILGLAVNLGLGGALLLWPGKSDDGALPYVDPLGEVGATTPHPPAAPVRYDTPVRTSFGRRGV